MEHRISINEGTSNQDLPNLVLQINKKLGELPATAELSREFFMSKVHKGLCSTVVKHEPYEPMLVSIGPYHYGKPELQAMEKHKLRYLRRFLLRKEEDSAERYIQALAPLESEARKHYVDLPRCLESSDKFVEMMLLDGCFIIEYFRSVSSRPIEQDDYFIRVLWMMFRICLDLILLENQLPFFVLTRLYESAAEGAFRDLAIQAFNIALPVPRLDFLCHGGNGTENITHLLHLVHVSFCPASNEPPSFLDEGSSKSENRSTRSSLEEPLLDEPTIGNGNGNDNNKKNNFKHWVLLKTMRRVVKLKEAGVKFQKVGGDEDESPSASSTNSFLFEIEFDKDLGLLKIPYLTVDDYTETLFRNLVAYEQHTCSLNHQYFSDFILLMDKLIDKEDDVKVLCDKGIIVNWLGDDKAVADLFNKISEGVINSSFSYYQLCTDLNKHCAKPWNTIKARLVGDYFYTPWAAVSTFAAVLLLILTIIQTTSSVKDLVN